MEHCEVLLQAKARFEVVNVKSEVKLSENDYEELRQILINRLREEGLQCDFFSTDRSSLCDDALLYIQPLFEMLTIYAQNFEKELLMTLS